MHTIPIASIPTEALDAFNQANAIYGIPAVRPVKATAAVTTTQHLERSRDMQASMKRKENAEVALIASRVGADFLGMTKKEQASEVRRVSGLNKILDGRSVADALDDIAKKDKLPDRPWLRHSK